MILSVSLYITHIRLCRAAVLLFLLGVTLCAFSATAQPDGWKMTDRFYGFRYEIVDGAVSGAGVLDAIQKEANLMGCFGWAQLAAGSPDGGGANVVGEARCAKGKGRKFENYLAQLAPGGKFNSLV